MTDDTDLDAVRYPVDPAVARSLAGPDGADAPECREFAEQVGDLRRRHLDGAPGYFVLSGLADVPADRTVTVLSRISRLVGPLLPQDLHGSLVREVRDRGTDLGTRTSRYSDTRHGGSLHTDGVHMPGAVPAFFGLFCVRPAAEGGELVLVRVEDLVRELASRPELLSALRRPVDFDTRSAEPGDLRTVRRPIVESVEGRHRVHYLRAYIESAQQHPGVEPLGGELLAALDVLDGLLERPGLQIRGRLEAGDLIFVDNRSVVHGRTTFRDTGDGPGRLLVRTWISEDTDAVRSA